MHVIIIIIIIIIGPQWLDVPWILVRAPPRRNGEVPRTAHAARWQALAVPCRQGKFDCRDYVAFVFVLHMSSFVLALNVDRLLYFLWQIQISAVYIMECLSDAITKVSSRYTNGILSVVSKLLVGTDDIRKGRGQYLVVEFANIVCS